MRKMNSRSILIEKYIKPSETQFINGSFVERWFDRNGDSHSFMGQPAFVQYYKGQIETQHWDKKDKRHREKDLPAVIYYNNGRIIIQEWYKKGKIIKIERY